MCIITGQAALGSPFAAAVAGGVVSTVGAIQQAQQGEAQAKYQADLAERNSLLASRQAENLDLQANQDRNQLRLMSLAQRGEARAGYASGGVVLGSGSAADYEADIADAYDLDSRNLEYDIASQKWKLQVQAADYASQASLYRAQAKGYRTQQMTSLLSGTFGTIGDTFNTTSSIIGSASKLGLLKTKEA